MRMGLPCVVVSDNGREFDNKLNDEICKTLGIKRRLITPYHPQVGTQVHMPYLRVKFFYNRKCAWIVTF